MKSTDLVTGAFGYTGKYIKDLLLARGRSVRTFTNHPDLAEAKAQSVQCFPYDFDNSVAMVKALDGVDTLYNTYWVRFCYGEITFETAIKNTLILLQAAKQANVRKFVHVSVSQPDRHCKLPYFEGKAILEEAVKNSGLDYAIMRPTVVFGREDILVNNIAWFIRKLPFVPVFNRGTYLVQPVFVGDLAAIAVDVGGKGGTEGTFDVAGPEIYSYRDLIRKMAEALDKKVHLFSLPQKIGFVLIRILGVFLQDIVLTQDEIEALVSGRLYSVEPPLAKTRFSDWIQNNSELLGNRYSSELARHFDGK